MGGRAGRSGVNRTPEFLSPSQEPCHLATPRCGSSRESRTLVSALKGQRLSRLTMEPYGAPSETRTQDAMIKSHVLCHLS